MRKKPSNEAVELLEKEPGKVIDPARVEKRRSELEHAADKYFGKPQYDPRNL